MKVAIIGAGKLGIKVATALLGGDHAITVIDVNEEKLNKTRNDGFFCIGISDRCSCLCCRI